MRLFVIGAGGHGRVVADAAEVTRRWSEIRFLDDLYPQLSATDGWPVDGRVSALQKLLQPGDQVCIGVGNSQTRLRLLNDVEGMGTRVVSVVHPSAVVSTRAVVGPGSVILAGVCVNVAVKLGRGVILNTGSTVDHDCFLDDGVHVSPGAHLGGGVRVGRLAWVGIGASVRHGVTIGDEAIIGAGAAVVSDIPASSTALGVPARSRAQPR